jgi:SAM-dependent MidA family methyltransferase
VNAVIAEIGRRRRVTFAEFMELALYHPTAGYYTRRRPGWRNVGAVGRQTLAGQAS